MFLRIDIDTSNDAFNGSDFEPELTTVLNNVLGCVCRVIRPQLIAGRVPGVSLIIDSNGNTCGRITATHDAPGHDDDENGGVS